MCDQKSIFILLIAAFVPAFTMRDASAADQTPRQQLESVTPFRLPDRITTLDGKTYEKVILDKVEPDGLLVLFSPVEGGSGTAKLKFRNLPVELRERYRYDADRVADFEAAQARGEAVWRAEHAVRMEQREAAQAEQAALERQMRAEAELRRAEAEQAQAQAEAARDAQDQPGGYYGGYYYPLWSSSWCDSGSRGGGRRFNNHVPHPQPVSGMSRSPSSPVFAPMRPSGK
jgi:hypothetical protein